MDTSLVLRNLVIEWVLAMGFEWELNDMEFISLVAPDGREMAFANNFINCFDKAVVLQNSSKCNLSFEAFAATYDGDFYCR